MMAKHFMKYTVLWNDLDPNVHLATPSYSKIAASARMYFFEKLGVSTSDILQKGYGPVAMAEEFFYFREAYINKEIFISMEVVAEDSTETLFKILHNYYTKEGKNFARSHCYMTWIDQSKRKKVDKLPSFLHEMMGKLKVEDLEQITFEQVKGKSEGRPENIDSDIFSIQNIL